MPRKILISFLGTNDYVPANYYLGDQANKVDNVRFIQEALLELICQDWDEKDVIKVFLTTEAEKKNWVDNGHLGRDNKVIECEGLKSRLEAFALHYKSKVSFEPIYNVPTGITETDVWDVFDAIYAQLEDGDEVYFDITHSFRSIPMLCMVLLNYAKYLKHITVKGIYYGAFEVLGSAYLVKNMAIGDRNAPIVDVTRFSMLQDWSIAAGDFATYGNADRLQEISSEVLKPFLAEAKGQDKSLLALNRAIKNTKKFTENIQTCRGKLIIENSAAKQIIDDLSNIKEHSVAIRPIVPLLAAVKSALSDFQYGSGVNNGYAAAKWCLKNNLIQQGLTILEETIISEICEEMNIPIEAEKERMLVSSCFNILHYEINEKEWKGEAASNKDLTNDILKNSLVLKKKSSSFLTISGIRNDINHAGMRKNASSYLKFQSILKENLFDSEKSISDKTPLFINFSNHPSSNWEEYQLSCASKYGKIIDFAFPAVDPEASLFNIETLAEDVIMELDRIAIEREGILSTVHIMGEHTLCYTVVSRLQQRNIKCVASTTERMVTQNGDEKISTFNFHGFREYPAL